MAMAMRASATSIAATRCSGLRGLFSTLSSASPFNPPHTNQTENPKAEPSTSLFVYGLSKRTTTEGLREAFTKFGEVVDARVITDRVSGFSKGFGFVKYTTIEEATKGITGMDGQKLDGWVIFAEYANPRGPRPMLRSPPRYKSPPYGGQDYGH